MKLRLMFGLFLSISILFSNLNAKIITIGTIDGEAENKLSKFEAVATYLQKKLNRKDITINVEIPKNITTAIKLIKAKKLDIFMDSIYPTLLVQKNTGLTIEAKRWKKGKESYRSIIFTKVNSKIEKIDDLKGKIIAFEDMFSTSAYYIPKKVLEKQNIILANTSNNRDALKYLFSKSEMNSAAWVVFGKVDAAATDNITFDSFDKDLYKVIYQSKPMARQLVSFSKRVDNTLKQEILDILFNMHKDERGAKILKTFSRTKKFTKIDKNEIKDWK